HASSQTPRNGPKTINFPSSEFESVALSVQRARILTTRTPRPALHKPSARSEKKKEVAVPLQNSCCAVPGACGRARVAHWLSARIVELPAQGAVLFPSHERKTILRSKCENASSHSICARRLNLTGR